MYQDRMLNQNIWTDTCSVPSNKSSYILARHFMHGYIGPGLMLCYACLTTNLVQINTKLWSILLASQIRVAWQLCTQKVFGAACLCCTEWLLGNFDNCSEG